MIPRDIDWPGYTEIDWASYTDRTLRLLAAYGNTPQVVAAARAELARRDEELVDLSELDWIEELPF